MDIAQLHFLVAEGDQVQRHALADILVHVGVGKITQAPDGHTALRHFSAGITPVVDIAIIDLALPGMDALELIRRLGEARCKAGVIIVGAQSNAVLFSVETMAVAYGVNVLGAIGKPVIGSRLVALIHNYVPPAEARGMHEAAPTLSFSKVGQGLQNREFDPFFQPKIELETGQVKGLEMFARWRHPLHGVLGPASFMPALETAQRVDYLDWTMIEKSVAACRKLHEQGVPISVSINVDQSTLAHPQFMEQIAACLERHRIMADYITFEMTESAVLSTDPHFLERLLRLRMAGFGLAIDDYGTGRSNLQLLARIPFSELKIDRSFVDGASKRSAIGTVLRSCLGLARSLDRRSVAVGVETKQDWDFLQSLGCTYAQGYYIAKPMPVEDFPIWLADWQHFF
ncbi:MULTISPECIES: EAL domain-containing protein [unclassified Duganella]|uniref:EAL domain-containing response regulator n=1 Tax=unclassified Duganella TaxID=2636909 RepID=UPI0008815C4F|nr:MULTISPECIES: EAL domain-containing response regulator [unclassified Duganella]SDF72167.1 EAL domain, c-di-GMP-specific phosphodiesterase class I (or its enzymatically inactive variant) [Duganella sp. OV458]SDI57247.1 EAL domain, c-di-GMP-specific phosphodiesterase class I (or its enzymatically inactive variant) [Duganella sp. OV510]